CQMSAADLTPVTSGSYLVFRNRDLVQHDYAFHRGSVAELQARCDSTPDCVGFNSLGYMKAHFTDRSLLTEMQGCDLYIRQDRIEARVQRSIQQLVARRLDITFVMTTCKRLALACDTLDHFLLNCKDSHLVARWLVIDDASSKADLKALRRRYPFLE